MRMMWAGSKASTGSKEKGSFEDLFPVRAPHLLRWPLLEAVEVSPLVARGEIMGVGLATEDPSVTVLSDGHPTGKGLQRALQATIRDAHIAESLIAFRVSDQEWGKLREPRGNPCAESASIARTEKSVLYGSRLLASAKSARPSARCW